MILKRILKAGLTGQITKIISEMAMFSESLLLDDVWEFI